jgi:uncharacterized protein YdaU (DUF1376 family)
MSAPPWMPFYVADYLADTRRLTTLEHGAYILLIMDYWRNGCLPDDDERLARIAGLPVCEWICVRIAIEPLFQHGWRHSRIDTELKKSADKAEKARMSAGKRWINKGNIGNAKALPTQCNGIANAMLSESDYKKDIRKRNSKEEFAQFWDAYGHKVDRPRAEKAFEKALSKTSIECIIAGVSRYRAGLNDLKFIKDPAAWLNGERWADEPVAMSPGPSKIVEMTTVFVKRDTPQWEAWNAHYWRTEGKSAPSSIKGGGYFPTEFPP